MKKSKTISKEMYSFLKDLESLLIRHDACIEFYSSDDYSDCEMEIFLSDDDDLTILGADSVSTFELNRIFKNYEIEK